MKDQGLRDLGHIGAIRRGPRIKVVGGESHLVVHHNVDSAACAVAIEARHLGHLVHHALSCHRGIAVNEDGQHTRLVAVAGIDAGARNAFHHGIHGLQVGGVGSQGDGHLLPCVGHLFAGISQVVLDVAVEQAFPIVRFAFKFTENVGVGLSENVGKCAQASAVGHADDHFPNTTRGAGLNQGIQRGDEAFTALERKAFLADELLLEELLKQCGLTDFLQHMFPAVAIQPWAVGKLNVFTHPLQPFWLADVHVFNPDGVAIRRFQMRNDVPQGGGANAHFAAGLKHGVQIGFREVEVFEREGRSVRAPVAHRVGLGEQMSPRAVPVHQIQNLEFFERRRGRRILTILGQTQVKPRKKKPPRPVHRIGVLAVASVHGFERARFSVAQK